MTLKSPIAISLGLLLALHFPGPQSAAAADVVISPVIDGDKADYGVAWKNFQQDLQSHLDRALPGKFRVKVNEKLNTASATLDALAADGGPQVFALSCGNTATALLDPDRYRYQTSFVLCDAHFQPLLYRPIFIVTRNPKFSALSAACTNVAGLAAILDSHPELKFGLGDPNSLSSYRVPVLVMTQRHHHWGAVRSSHQNDLIKQVVSGRIFAASVADDVLRLAGDWNSVRALDVAGDGVNPILTHGFPAISFGWRSDLPRELQDCISNTFASHNWPGDKAFTSAYTGIKNIPVGGIAKVDHPNQLWDPVIQIMKLPAASR